MQCGCGCGEEIAPERINQVYLNATHREAARNRRRPRVRVPTDAAALLRITTTRQQAISAMGTVGKGTEMAETKKQRRNRAMGKQESSELLSSFQVAGLLGMSAWNLILWRKKGFGPPFLRVTRSIIRYPKPGFDAWLASLRKNL
jgi:hypothetical protein